MIFGKNQRNPIHPIADWSVQGADLTHSPEKPSIAAVVASLDQQLMRAAAEVSVQKLVEPSTNASGQFGLLRSLQHGS